MSHFLVLWQVKADQVNQWRIQDFPQGGAPIPKIANIFQNFAENCMKMKEFGLPGGGGASLAPPPPWIRQCKYFEFQELPALLGIIEDILCGMMNPNEAIEFFPI